MNKNAIIKNKQQIEELFGKWTAHNILLGHNIYTLDGKPNYGPNNVKRVLQIVSDTSNKPIKQLRILDLACLEGQYSIELAKHGAQVVAIEGRDANLQKALFAQKALGLKNIDFVRDDVRNLSKIKYGVFDVVLCLGILYHLDVTSVFKLTEKITEVCNHFAVFDTHISISGKIYHTYDSKKYFGSYYVEHGAHDTSNQKSKRLWASLDNVRSFWLTRPSLYNLLNSVGFTSVYECVIPTEIKQPYDRMTLLAMKGKKIKSLTQPFACRPEDQIWPEVRKIMVDPSQQTNFIKLLRNIYLKFKYHANIH